LTLLGNEREEAMTAKSGIPEKIDLDRWLSHLQYIENRVKKLTLLAKLSQLLNSTLDPYEIRRMAMEAACQLIDAEVASLLLLDKRTKKLYFEIALGENEKTLKTLTLNLGEGIAGWVAKTGKPLLVNQPEKERRFLREIDRKTRFKTRNLLCVPVKAKRKVVGVLEVVNKKGETGFDEGDLSLLTSLSDQVAIALDNARLYQELEETFFQTAESLAEAIEQRDPYTGGHTRRVGEYSLAIAKHLKLNRQEKKWLKIASALHDIGKIGIEDRILRKPERLSREEFDTIKLHSNMGAEILKHIRQLKEIIPGVKYHHEKVNGAGYPEGLRGEKIPLLARIVAVADTYDAMTTDRPYRPALSKEEAVRELKRCAGTQFDENVVRAFNQAYRRGEI
jgi:HD-GYP domain-containing protein (c-di-GMP phosphodiesterase class II)